MTDAELHNFRPPQPPSFAQPVPATTDIVCYFNPNQWPVHVSNNLLGITLTLTGRGDQLRSVETGELVNDPRLMCFVGQGQLSCTRGPEQRPVVTYRSVTANATPSASNFPHGFAASQSAMPNGKTTIPAAVPPPTPPINSTSVTAFMDRESAIRAGLIDGRVVELAEGVADTEGAPPQNVPEMRVPAYRNTGVDMAKFAAAQAETAAQRELVTSLVSAASAPDADPIQQAIAASVPASVSAVPLPVATAPASVVTAATPPTAIVPPAAPVAPPTPPASDTSVADFHYKDPTSGRSFEYRSLLERFLKANYPQAKVDEVMALYPRTNNRGRRMTP